MYYMHRICKTMNQMYVNMHIIVVLMQYCTWCRVYNIVYSIYTYYKYIYTYMSTETTVYPHVQCTYVLGLVHNYAHNIYVL